MLVAALGVEVGAGVGIFRLLLGVGVDVEDGVGAGAGLEKNIEDVHLLAELGVAARSAGGAGGEHLFGRVDVPGVGELAHEKGDDGFVDGGVAERLAALAAEGEGGGGRPYFLAGGAAVGA